MTIEILRDYCLCLSGVTEDIKWGHNLCFSVGTKMFLITNPDDYPVSASFKTTDELYESLCCRDGIIPAPYLSKNKWVLIEDISSCGQKEWEDFIQQSYQLVYSKLSAKIKASFK